MDKDNGGGVLSECGDSEEAEGCSHEGEKMRARQRGG